MPLRRAPYPYLHPDRRDAAPETEPTEAPVAALPDVGIVPSVADHIDLPTTDVERLVIPIRFPFPAPGTVPAYDRMVADGVPHRLAVLAVGRRAADWFESHAAELSLAGSWREPVGSRVGVLTSRTLPSGIVAIARAALDPHGVLRDKAFGRQFGPALLEWWTEHDLVS